MTHVYRADGKSLEYYGWTVGGKRNGFGVSFFEADDDGRTPVHFQGHWCNDKPNGYGTLFFRSGKISMAGDFQDGEPFGLVHTYDKLGRPLFNGTVFGRLYTGTVMSYLSDNDDQWFTKYVGPTILVGSSLVFHGDHGSFSRQVVRPDGTTELDMTYVGGFKHGKFHGKGTWTVGLNEAGMTMRYAGDFKEDVFEGFGTLARGDMTFEGQFVDGKPTGTGTKKMKGRLVQQGHFVNGKLNGKGRMLYTDDDTWAVGDFVDGKMVFGELARAGRVVYSGETNGRVFHGEGTAYLVVDDSQSRGLPVTTTWTNGLMAGGELEVMSSTDNGDTQKVIVSGSVVAGTKPELPMALTNATLAIVGGRSYQGDVKIDTKGRMLCDGYGTVLHHGRARYETECSNSHIVSITALYDESGSLAIRPAGPGAILDNMQADGWPAVIEGPMAVYNDAGNVMYEAEFAGGSVTKKDLREKILKGPSVTLAVAEQPVDMVSLDAIPFGTAAYALNVDPTRPTVTANLVRFKTMMQMQAAGVLNKHPLTRAPVMRITKVLVVKAAA